MGNGAVATAVRAGQVAVFVVELIVILAGGSPWPPP